MLQFRMVFVTRNVSEYLPGSYIRKSIEYTRIRVFGGLILGSAISSVYRTTLSTPKNAD